MADVKFNAAEMIRIIRRVSLRSRGLARSHESKSQLPCRPHGHEKQIPHARDEHEGQC